MKRLLSIILMILFVACESSETAKLAPRGSFDVTVGEVHITQGIQPVDPRFWLDLVAMRNTAVRAEIRTESGVAGPVDGVLRVYVDGMDITNGGIPALNNGFTPPPNNRSFFNLLQNEADTLNFELIASEMPLRLPAGLNSSTDVDFVVEISGDSATLNNTARIEDLTLVKRYSPTIFQPKLVWDDPRLNATYGFPAPMDDRMLKALWPIPDVEVNAPVPGFVPPEPDPSFSPYRLPPVALLKDCDGDNKLTFTPTVRCPPVLGQEVYEPNLLLYRLEQYRQALVNVGWGPDDYTYLYGWVANGGLAGHDGLTWQISNGNSWYGLYGYGIDQPSDGQFVFAHEFGHMMGEDHNDPGRVVQNTGWDTGARLHNQPNGMRDGGRVKQAGTYTEVMNENSLATTANTWVDLTSYQAVLDSPSLSPAHAGFVCDELRLEDTETLVVYGLPGQLEGQPSVGAQVITYPWCTEPKPMPENPNLSVGLELLDPSGETTRLDLLANASMKLPGSEEEGLAPFTLPLPVKKGTKVLSMTVKSLEDEFETVELSALEQQPDVTLQSPQAGDTLSGETVIAWEASAQAELSVQVLYSFDNGLSFVPLAISPEEAKISMNVKDLPETKDGQGLIRIIVNDGFNTVFQEVNELSVR